MVINGRMVWYDTYPGYGVGVLGTGFEEEGFCKKFDPHIFFG
jgi:hypothetical protein